MSKLGKLLGIGSDDERFIEGLLDDLDTLGINYPDISDVEFLDTNEIIYSIMYEIRNAFERDFSEYIVSNDIDLDNFQIDIRTNCLDSDYEISYKDEYASDGCIDTYVSGDSDKAFKELLKEFGIEVEDDE